MQYPDDTTIFFAEQKHGGLKMMDFEIMDKALKIAWIKRLNEQSDASSKIILEKAVNLYGGLSFLTNCHFDINLLDLQNVPPFCHVVLKYWQLEFKLLTACDEKTPENEIIWNNFNILVDQKSIFYNTWFKKGIVQVKDLVDKNRDFLSLADFKQKFNVDTPFTLYYGLIRAIPIRWKNLIRSADHIAQSSTPVTLTSAITLSTRIAYKAILSKSFATPTNENRILNYGFTKENVHNVYLLPFLVTKEAKLIAFQFKIVHNILPTRASLFHAGLVDDDSCPLCNSEKQSLAHVL